MATGSQEIRVGSECSMGAIEVDLQRKKNPDAWRERVTVPTQKDKGAFLDCENYREIKLMPHTMKFFERIIEKRLRCETKIAEQQFGFMPGRETTNAML